ncbi:DMT family transporter [Nitratireductor sp. L1-7-SE]|uniref:DMT family transporter n=1 Tax=Nitratireductor rhodophyticola TaxID=2854036 RepID=A0ABS7REE1_9HYPH|nr:DMT family transporter [Nitratireductor rhodophyticola]MBY8918038.1 DMT family transporter [Nitratireductor rhodophyticola]MBY8921153.1 DMT family transporter [Nitratireductor rhodophyticola]
MPAVTEVGAERQPLMGIALKVISVSVFVMMSSLIKSAGIVPSGQIVFFRSFFAIFPIIAMLAWRRELATAFRTTHPVSHIMRGLVGVTAMGLGFFALTRLPLPDAITLNYAQPLIVVVLSAIFMGEVVRIYRWSAVAVGFVGVIIIAWPKLTLLTGDAGLEAAQAVGVIAALCGATGSAVAMLLVRRLVQTEKTATIVLWFSVTATVLSLFTIPFGWADLSREQYLALAGAGVCGGVAQILMTECYRHAELSTIAPFEYTSMLLAIVIGYFAFGDVPTLYTLVGGMIVIGAGLFIIWRERRLGLKRVAARRFVPPAS